MAVGGPSARSGGVMERGAMQSRGRVVPINRAEKEAIMATLTDHRTRIEVLEKNDKDFEEMAKTINKIYRWIKRGLPIVVTAAVSSGIVSGKWGAFFAALFH